MKCKKSLNFVTQYYMKSLKGFRCVRCDVVKNYLNVQGESKKSSPPNIFNDIFTQGMSFCLKFCPFV